MIKNQLMIHYAPITLSLLEVHRCANWSMTNILAKPHRPIAIYRRRHSRTSRGAGVIAPLLLFFSQQPFLVHEIVALPYVSCSWPPFCKAIIVYIYTPLYKLIA